jgi:hypothetical protein
MLFLVFTLERMMNSISRTEFRTKQTVSQRKFPPLSPWVAESLTLRGKDTEQPIQKDQSLLQSS